MWHHCSHDCVIMWSWCFSSGCGGRCARHQETQRTHWPLYGGDHGDETQDGERYTVRNLVVDKLWLSKWVVLSLGLSLFIYLFSPLLCPQIDQRFGVGSWSQTSWHEEESWGRLYPDLQCLSGIWENVDLINFSLLWTRLVWLLDLI